MSERKMITWRKGGWLHQSSDSDRPAINPVVVPAPSRAPSAYAFEQELTPAAPASVPPMIGAGVAVATAYVPPVRVPSHRPSDHPDGRKVRLSKEVDPRRAVTQPGVRNSRAPARDTLIDPETDLNATHGLSWLEDGTGSMAPAAHTLVPAQPRAASVPWIAFAACFGVAFAAGVKQLSVESPQAAAPVVAAPALRVAVEDQAASAAPERVIALEMHTRWAEENDEAKLEDTRALKAASRPPRKAVRAAMQPVMMPVGVQDPWADDAAKAPVASDPAIAQHVPPRIFD